MLTEVLTLAGPRYARGDAHPEVVRWGAQPGSIYLADQKVPIRVPRVRVRVRVPDRRAGGEVALKTYAAFHPGERAGVAPAAGAAAR